MKSDENADINENKKSSQSDRVFFRKLQHLQNKNVSKIKQPGLHIFQKIYGDVHMGLQRLLRFLLAYPILPYALLYFGSIAMALSQSFIASLKLLSLL